MSLFLPIHFAQFEHLHRETALENFGRKKIGRGILLPKNGCFRIRGDYRRKLKQIPKKHHLQSAERPRVFPIDAEKEVYMINEIGAHHRDFINDQHFELGVQPPVAALFDLAFGKHPRRKSKK
jgi:hypothetical protein